MTFVIHEAKIVEYLLKDPGKSKFFIPLVITRFNWSILRDDILEMAENFPKKWLRATEFGNKYEIVGQILTPIGRSITLKSGWFELDEHPDVFRFITAYPA